jgi:hypothetical protein
LNAVCGAWLRGRSRLSRIDLTADIIQYHQAHNLAAKESRLRTDRDTS